MSENPESKRLVLELLVERHAQPHAAQADPCGAVDRHQRHAHARLPVAAAQATLFSSFCSTLLE
jgi:hypothetical protein